MVKVCTQIVKVRDSCRPKDHPADTQYFIIDRNWHTDLCELVAVDNEKHPNYFFTDAENITPVNWITCTIAEYRRSLRQTTR